jgi:hypothetical protein
VTERTTVNVTTGELDMLSRLSAAQRELGEVASTLLGARTMKGEDRRQLGRRLNAVKDSLKTVELTLVEDDS